jgi:hypothetical protein
VKLDGNAELKRKYLDYKMVGQLMTFPAFMSVSTDDSVADDFGDFVFFFVFVKVRGAKIARLSQLPKEAEIFCPSPVQSEVRRQTGRYFGARVPPVDVFEPHGVALFCCDGCWHGRSRCRHFVPTTTTRLRLVWRLWRGTAAGFSVLRFTQLRRFWRPAAVRTSRN